MKLRILFLLFFPCVLYAQDDISPRINELKEKINATSKGEKLKWMDSLTYTVFQRSDLGFDSIVQQTITYAIELDSFNMAASHISSYMSYCNNYIGKPKKGKALFNQYYPVLKGKVSPLQEANLFIDGGDSQDFTGDKDKALQYYDRAIAIGSQNNLDRVVGIANTYKGYVLGDMGEFAKASESYQKAVRIFRKLQDTSRIIGVKNSLSILYSQNSFYEEAKREREEPIKLAEATGRMGQLVSFYYNEATDLRKQGDFEGQLTSLRKSYEASKKSDRASYYEPILLSSFATAYAKIDSLDKANYYLRELEKNEDYTTGTNEENYIQVKKNIAFARGQYEQALELGMQHLTFEQATQSFEDIRNAESFLATTYEKLNNPKEAYAHFKRAARISDSINGIRNVKALTYYQTLYETEKRDAKIQAQQSSINLLDAQNRIKSQWMLFGGLGVLSLFGAVLLVRSRNSARRRQRTQERFSQDLIKTQEEERTRVARELHDSVGQKLMLLTKKTKTSGDENLGSLADTTLAELRSISRGLYPANLERLGVTKAIEGMINEVDANTNIFFTNDIENIDDTLSREANLHLYRIIQETLNNMVKHAEARAASVSIEKHGKFIDARISDNGKGFYYSDKIKSSNSLGMKTLLERAKILHSKLEIKSELNKGTTITLHIPRSI